MNHDLYEEIASLARELPPGVLYAISDELTRCRGTHWSQTRLQLLRVVPQVRFKERIATFLDLWRDRAPDVSSESLAHAVRTAIAVTAQQRREQSIELVWTGPDVPETALRRTDQVLLQVIESARRSLLLVSFAVYHVASIAQAVVGAANRGVVVRICIEAPEPSEQMISYDTIRALGPEVFERALVYVWPREMRPTDAHGRRGTLHAKCAVADEKLLFISSANLTEHAMSINIELGVLVRGGPFPVEVVEHFNRLIERGTFKPIHR